jgi:hypothetical protein
MRKPGSERANKEKKKSPPKWAGGTSKKSPLMAGMH